MVNATDAEMHNRLHGAAVPRQWATHGGEDVAVYATGPQGITQALFSGTFDQSYVPHAIAYVACLSEYAERCRRQDAEAVNRSNSDATFIASKAGVLGVGASSQVTFFFNGFFAIYFSKFDRQWGHLTLSPIVVISRCCILCLVNFVANFRTFCTFANPHASLPHP